MIVINDLDIKGEDYRSLIELASKKCDKFAFVKRRDMMANEKVAMKYHDKLVKDIKGSFIERKEQSEWVVTELLEATAYVFYPTPLKNTTLVEWAFVRWEAETGQD